MTQHRPPDRPLELRPDRRFLRRPPSHAVLGAGLICLGLAAMLPGRLAAQQAATPPAAAPVAPAPVPAIPGAATPGAADPAGAAVPAARPRPARPRTMRSAQEEAGEPRANTSAPAPAPTTGPAPVGRRGPASADHVDLDTTTVTGNREQPKVMYVVPWKKADIGDMVAKPMNSLLDEVLAPVDRDEFRREVSYYQAVKGDADAAGRGPGAGGTPATQGEK